MREKKGTEDREERENGDSFLDEDQIAVVFLDGLEHVDGERREVLHRIYPVNSTANPHSSAAA